MLDFENIVINKFGFIPCSYCHKYSDKGKAYNIDDDNFKGIYWFYETDEYIIDITDLYIKRDVVINENFKISDVAFVSNYIMTGEGEWFEPYQSINSNSVLIIEVGKTKPHYLLYGQRPYLSVGLKFKKKLIDKIENKYQNEKLYNIFFETKETVTKALFKISEEILKNRNNEPSVNMFFESRAKEWLYVSLKAYEQKNRDTMSLEDEKAILNVGRYIDENYSKNITQGLLENIALMSGTKLKVKFKEKFNMSITEYIQRKRINVAESLILNSNLSISEISNKVGYVSNSRFSLLFKRYKGLKPTEVKSVRGKTGCLGCPMYNKCEVVQ